LLRCLVDSGLEAGLIPIRLNLDLVQVGVAGEAAQALCGECIPGSAEGIDDGVCCVEQAVAPVLLAQIQPDPFHRLRGTAPKAEVSTVAARPV